MYTYPWYHWITFFYLYCFFGWIFESTYVSFKQHRFVNRGFLRLPMLPLYGTGAVMMLWVSLPVKDNLFLVYLFGVIAATILEYVTGYVMERLFKMKYWDYSNQRFQLNGYICLSSSIAWGFLTIFMTELIHKPIADFVLRLPLSVEFIFLTAVSVLFVADAVKSTKEALDLGRALEAMTKLKAEAEEMQVQIALLKAETSQRVSEFRENAADRMADLRNDASVRVAELREDAALRFGELREEAAARTDWFHKEAALLDRLTNLTERHRQFSTHISVYRRRLLRGNPSASSGKFSEALRELREALERRE